MSSLKTFVFSSVLIGLSATAGMAQTNFATTMAQCAGRYSAEVEHAWLMSDPESEVLSQQMENFSSILEAVIPADAGREMLVHRVDAKAAHAKLLSEATFGTDKARAAWAKKQAIHYRKACASYLLES